MAAIQLTEEDIGELLKLIQEFLASRLRIDNGPMPEKDPSAGMASLKTICKMYDWKYDTIYKKWKKGQFVVGFRDPAGRGIRFDLSDVAKWAKQAPIDIGRPSLILGRI